MSTAVAARTYRGSVEVAAAVALYAIYELVRGFGSDDFGAARVHTDAIVSLEQHLGLYVERAVQTASLAVPGLGSVLGFLYMGLHFLGTAAFLVWVHRRRRDSFPLVRTTLIFSTAIALVGYVLYPAAPPRLANLGFHDAVSSGTGLNLSSDMLGALYNPIAAVPSLHFGYSLIVGVGLATLARRRWVKIIGALYAPAMLYIIVATGNHFLFDAAAGGLVVAIAYAGARLVASPRAPLPQPVHLPVARYDETPTRLAA
jgi:PAP2 superfamily